MRVRARLPERDTHTPRNVRSTSTKDRTRRYVQPSKHSRAGGQADGRHGEGRTCTCACASTDGHALRDSYEHVLVRACSAVRAAAGAVRVLARETFGHSVDRGAGGSGGDAMTFGGEGVWPGQGEASCAVCLNLGGRAGRRVCCVRWRRGASARQQKLGWEKKATENRDGCLLAVQTSTDMEGAGGEHQNAPALIQSGCP